MFPRPWQISFLKNNVSTSSSHIKSSKSVRYKIWTVLIKFDTSQILLENCFPEKCRLDYSTVRQEILQGEYFNLEDSEWYVVRYEAPKVGTAGRRFRKWKVEFFDFFGQKNIFQVKSIGYDVT